MNDRHKQLFERIKAFSFDKSGTEFTFSQRLARENGWTIEYVDKVIKEYQKFVFLAVVAEHIVTPSEQIDRVWHLHLTYTRSYWDEFCPNVLGQPLHHQPTQGGNLEQRKYDDLYRKTLDSYIKYFGDRPPIDIWSSPELRFGRDLSFEWVNTQENWIISKPNIFYIKSAIYNLLNKFSKTATVITALFLVVLIFFVTALPSLAKDIPFYWDFINVTLDVQNNGDLLVTEEQKYVFTDYNSHQRYRFIKLGEIKAIEDVRVFEDNRLLPIETTSRNGQFWIKWQDYLDNKDTHTFILKYRAVGAITNSYGVDKLNWKAIFPKREGTINNSEITVNSPESLAGKLKNYYTIGGNFKSTLINDTSIRFNSLQTIPPKQSTVVKLIFSGNFLDINKTKTFPVLKQETEHSIFSDLFGYLIVSLVILIFVGSIIVFIFSFYQILTSSKSNNSGGGGGYGGCGGCGGCGGYGGGCGGGG